MSSRKSILHKTIQVGSSTMISRLLGIVREVVSAKYLGAGALSDAFFTAYKVPNSLRKIFAEGALSAAFIPPFVTALRANKDHAARLMSLAFVVFEGLLLLVCAGVIWIAPTLISWIAPGFSPEQIALTVPLLRLLMPLIFFISSSALLASALQAVERFFVPAFGPILLNIFYILGLVICWHWQLPVLYLCLFILLGGFFQLVQHLIAYFKLGFSFGDIDEHAVTSFKPILGKFFLCLASMSIMEINLFIDTSFASFLPEGSISLIYYANRFMGIPLGVFAVAFSTILLPHFSRIGAYAPKRLHFYLYESAKLIFWVTIPATLAICFFARHFFETLFHGSFSASQIDEASGILIAFTIELFFFSFSKILCNIFYALHDTLRPGIVSGIAAVINIMCNALLMPFMGATGLAFATTISGIVQVICLMYLLRQKYHFTFYEMRFAQFCLRYIIQLALCAGLFVGLFYSGLHLLSYLPASMATFFTLKIGLWLWVGPLGLLLAWILYETRKKFGLQIYFLD